MAAQKQEKKLSAKYFSAFLNAYYPNTHLSNLSTLLILEHVHKYVSVFGYFVDILMAVTFLSTVLFQKQNEKSLCES